MRDAEVSCSTTLTVHTESHLLVGGREERPSLHSIPPRRRIASSSGVLRALSMTRYGLFFSPSWKKSYSGRLPQRSVAYQWGLVFRWRWRCLCPSNLILRFILCTEDVSRSWIFPELLPGSSSLFSFMERSSPWSQDDHGISYVSLDLKPRGPDLTPRGPDL